MGKLTLPGKVARNLRISALNFREKSHKSWFHPAMFAGRLGDKRGYIAHGKARTKTSGHNLIT